MKQMLIVMNCQTFWPKSRDFFSGSLKTRHETTLGDYTRQGIFITGNLILGMAAW